MSLPIQSWKVQGLGPTEEQETFVGDARNHLYCSTLSLWRTREIHRSRMNTWVSTRI